MSSSAPDGQWKAIYAEFAPMWLWNKRELLRAICIEPYQEIVDLDLRVGEFKAKFGSVQGGKKILSLTGETSSDLRLLEKGDVLVQADACGPSILFFRCGRTKLETRPSSPIYCLV